MIPQEETTHNLILQNLFHGMSTSFRSVDLNCGNPPIIRDIDLRRFKRLLDQ